MLGEIAQRRIVLAVQQLRAAHPHKLDGAKRRADELRLLDDTRADDEVEAAVDQALEQGGGEVDLGFERDHRIAVENP